MCDSKYSNNYSLFVNLFYSKNYNYSLFVNVNSIAEGISFFVVSQPRLGPKPFQAKSGNQEFSFDKVFSVPVAPTNENNGYLNDCNIQTEANSEKTDAEKSPTLDNDRVKEVENGKSDSSSIEEDANSSDSGYKPKTPSTAERRKLFESKVKDESPENEESGNFERGNVNRNSIAERRRLYESRSVSVTDGNLAEKAMGSPTPLRRRDSFKTKNEIIKEEEVKKNVPILRQQSMDPRLEKPEPTPTPKRTSTVFGKLNFDNFYKNSITYYTIFLSQSKIFFRIIFVYMEKRGKCLVLLL